MAINYAQTLSFNLAGSGSASGDTSIILKTFSDIDGNVLTMADFGTKGFGTMEPGVQGQEEQISFTGVTANVNGTYTLTGVSHVSSKTPYTETSGLNLAHNGSTVFVISNTAKFYDTFTNKNNDETITGSWSFPTPTINSNPATKQYADGLAIAGAPDASTTVKGIGRLAQAPVSATDPIFVGDNDTRIPSQDESDALDGTSGTPNAANKYVTNDDTSVTAVASKIVRASATKKIDPAYIQNFSGDGSDGVLSVNAGTTTIDLGAQAVVIKQYTSVAITGTGSVVFINPHTNGTLIIIKSQGNVDLTSSTIPNLDASGMGGAGGATTSVTNYGTNGQNNGGSDATNPVTNYQDSTSFAQGRGAPSNSTSGGTASSIFSNRFLYTLTDVGLSNRKITIAPGFGGGSGGAGSTAFGGVTTQTGGAGGRGGGALVIQCGGALNFTSTLGVDVSGKAGTAGGNATTSNGFQVGTGGGGGGGGAGMCLILYNTLTSASGTINAKGGNGGAGGNATTTGTGGGSAAAAGGGGSGGASYISAGGAGGTGGALNGSNNNGSAGNGGTSGSGGGGGGGSQNGSGTAASTTGGAGGIGGATSTSLWYITKNYFIS